MSKSIMIIETTKLGCNDCYYLILPNEASGRKNRYTVYRIKSSPCVSGRTKVVGRELPLRFAKKYVANLIKNNGKYIRKSKYA